MVIRSYCAIFRSVWGIPYLVAIQNNAPPMVPSHVLLGEWRSHILCFPSSIPVIYAKLSLTHIRMKIIIVNPAQTLWTSLSNASGVIIQIDGSKVCPTVVNGSLSLRHSWTRKVVRYKTGTKPTIIIAK